MQYEPTVGIVDEVLKSIKMILLFVQREKNVNNRGDFSLAMNWMDLIKEAYPSEYDDSLQQLL